MNEKNNKKWLSVEEKNNTSLFSVQWTFEKEFNQWFDNNKEFDEFRKETWFLNLKKEWLKKLKEIDKTFIKKFDQKSVDKGSMSFLGTWGGKKIKSLLSSHLIEILNFHNNQKSLQISEQEFSKIKENVGFMFKAASNHFMYCLMEVSTEKIDENIGRKKFNDVFCLWREMSDFMFEPTGKKKIGYTHFEEKIIEKTNKKIVEENLEEKQNQEPEGDDDQDVEEEENTEDLNLQESEFVVELSKTEFKTIEEFAKSVSGYFLVSKDEEDSFSLKRKDLINLIQDEKVGLLTPENIHYLISDTYTFNINTLFSSVILKDFLNDVLESKLTFKENNKNLMNLFFVTKLKEEKPQSIKEMFDLSVDLNNKIEKEVFKKQTENYIKEFLNKNINKLFKDETLNCFEFYDNHNAKNNNSFFLQFIPEIKEKNIFFNELNNIIIFLKEKQLFNSKDIANFLLESIDKKIEGSFDLEEFNEKLREFILYSTETEEEKKEVRNFFISTPYISWKTKSKFVDEELLNYKENNEWTKSIGYQILKSYQQEGVIFEKEKFFSYDPGDSINAFSSNSSTEFKFFISSLMKAIKAENTIQVAAPIIRAIIRSSDKMSTKTSLGSGSAWSSIFSSSFIFPVKEHKIMAEIAMMGNENKFKEKYSFDLFSNNEHYKDLNSRIAILNQNFPFLYKAEVKEANDSVMKEINFYSFPILVVALKDILHFSKMAPKEVLEKPSHVFNGFFKSFMFLCNQVQVNMKEEETKTKIIDVLNLCEEKIKGNWVWNEKEQQYDFERNDFSENNFISSALIEFNKNINKKVVFKRSLLGSKELYFINFEKGNQKQTIKDILPKNELEKLKLKIQQDIDTNEKVSSYAFLSSLATVFSEKKQSDFFVYLKNSPYTKSKDFSGYFLNKLNNEEWVEKIALKVALERKNDKKSKSKQSVNEEKNKTKISHRF